MLYLLWSAISTVLGFSSFFLHYHQLCLFCTLSAASYSFSTFCCKLILNDWDHEKTLARNVEHSTVWSKRGKIYQRRLKRWWWGMDKSVQALCRWVTLQWDLLLTNLVKFRDLCVFFYATLSCTAVLTCIPAVVTIVPYQQEDSNSWIRLTYGMGWSHILSTLHWATV